MSITRVVPVAMGEWRVSTDPDTRLVAYGLGSCVGVAVYDARSGIGGLFHAMLPPDPNARPPLTRYADHGIHEMVRALVRHGARLGSLRVYLVGGASVLAPVTHRDHFQIGERNLLGVRAALREHGLCAVAEDVGGETGRTLELAIADGIVTVRKFGRTTERL